MNSEDSAWMYLLRINFLYSKALLLYVSVSLICKYDQYDKTTFNLLTTIDRTHTKSIRLNNSLEVDSRKILTVSVRDVRNIKENHSRKLSHTKSKKIIFYWQPYKTLEMVSPSFFFFKHEQYRSSPNYLWKNQYNILISSPFDLLFVSFRFEKEEGKVVDTKGHICQMACVNC